MDDNDKPNNLFEIDVYEKWKSLDITDNFCFQAVMQNPGICKEFIEKAFEIKLLGLHRPENEKSIAKRRDRKSIRLDVYAEDDVNNPFDLEMQTVRSTDDLKKRIRYYGDLIDLNMLQPGLPYSSLANAGIMFICPFDPFGDDEKKYTFVNVCQETGRKMDDGVTKIFLNAKGTRGRVHPDIQDFFNYMLGSHPKSGMTKRMHDELTRVKNSEEWRMEYMTWEMELLEQKRRSMEEGRKEGRKEGQIEGRKAGVLSATINMLRERIPYDTISRVSNYPIEEIEKIAKEHGLAY